MASRRPRTLSEQSTPTPGGRLTLRRRLFVARERFHDWMWSGGPGYGWTPRRLARRLPLYFSDPYFETPAKMRATMARSTPVQVTGPRRPRQVPEED